MAGRRPPHGAGEGLLRPQRPEGVLALDDMIAALVELDANGLCLQWRNHLGRDPSRPFAALAAHEDPSLSHPGYGVRRVRQRDAARPAPTEGSEARIIGLHPFEARIATTREGTKLKAGALLAREWNGRIERVMILDNGFAWNGETYGSRSQVAKAMTGTSWNGHRFFG